MAIQITIIICGTFLAVAILGFAVQLLDSVLHFVGFGSRLSSIRFPLPRIVEPADLPAPMKDGRDLFEAELYEFLATIRRRSEETCGEIGPCPLSTSW